MAEIYSTISKITFSLSAVFFLLSIFVWFKLNIFKVIGDLSGRSAKKAIEQIREENEKWGKKPYYSSLVNLNQGKLAESLKVSGEFGMRGNSANMLSKDNSLRHAEASEEIIPLKFPEGTVLLRNSEMPYEETTLLK